MKRLVPFAVIVCLTCLAGCNLPTSVPCSTDALIDAIADANLTPATTDTLSLATGCTYLLDQVIDTTNGNNGLPPIVSPIVIEGNGAVIKRAVDASEKFRLFYVNYMGTLEISALTLTGGFSTNPALPNDIVTNSGGAILNRGQLIVKYSVIQENYAREGGGIFNVGSMILSSVTVDSNHDYFGLPGGAGLYNLGTGTIENSTFSYNGLPEIKDGIFNIGTLTMTNSTVSHSGFTGIDNEGDLSLNHVTIAFNRGVAIGSCGNLYISNSIIAQPAGTGGCGCNTIHALHPNLDTTGTCGGILVSMDDLKLGVLADNGGPTFTHALLPGSLAIDIVQRQCLPSDQRGETRPYGSRCDAGAFEFTGAALPLLGGTASPDPTWSLTPRPPACSFTPAVPLNCRSGPGAELYEVTEILVAGQSVPVVGQSPDGQYLYVIGPGTGLTCTVPLAEPYGTTTGDCSLLPTITPLPGRIPTSTIVPAIGPVDCSALDWQECLNQTQLCTWVTNPKLGGGMCQALPASP